MKNFSSTDTSKLCQISEPILWFRDEQILYNSAVKNFSNKEQGDSLSVGIQSRRSNIPFNAIVEAHVFMPPINIL